MAGGGDSPLACRLPKPAWRGATPPGDEAAVLRRLEEKAVLAARLFQYDSRLGRVRVDALAAFDAAARLLPRLPRVGDYGDPPPQAWRLLAETVPSLLAARAAARRAKAGLLVNEILALEGPGGVGKTTLAYYVAAVHGGCIATTEEEMLEVLRWLVERGEWRPIVVLDDLASLVSKYWMLSRSERRWVKLFQAVEYAKDWSGVLLFTARSFEGVAKRFRELAGLVGSWIELVHGDYLVHLIAWRRPGRWQPVYVDIVWPYLRLPEAFWSEMMRRRRERARSLLEELAAGGGEP